MPPTQAAWTVYNKQLSLLHHGDALWEPAPIYSYKRIKLGDVGYIHRGCFHLLFSAGCPLGLRRLGVDVPDTFEPLDIGPIIRSQPRLPGHIGTRSVQKIGAGLGASVSATPFVDPGVNLSFALFGKQGAALITNNPTYREDIEAEDAFGKYTKRHYNSWVTFARKQHGNHIRPVLVTGVDMTKDFAMIAYSENGTTLFSRFTASAPHLATASASVWGTWHTEGLVHTNCGPQLCAPPSPSDTLELPPPDTAQIDVTPNEFNQCVFIRYYTIRRKALSFPKLVKAGAGPHDLGPGNNHDETLPELTAQLSLDSDDGYDSGGNPTTNYPSFATSHDSDLELCHHVSSEERDVFDDIAEYIFQNSEAEAALVHHHDIPWVREGMVKTETSEVLSLVEPDIEVDGNGVGRLVRRAQRGSGIFLPSLPLGYPSGVVGEDTTNRSWLENSTESEPEPRTGLGVDSCIPSCTDRRESGALVDGVDQVVKFTMSTSMSFPAEFALAGHCDILVGGDDVVFAEEDRSIVLQINWPGYDRWEAKIRTVNCQEEPNRITRAKLVKEIAQQLEKFIEKRRTAPIDPDYADYRVGPGGIELRHIHIGSLERASRTVWNPRLMLSFPTISQRYIES